MLEGVGTCLVMAVGLECGEAIITPKLQGPRLGSGRARALGRLSEPPHLKNLEQVHASSRLLELSSTSWKILTAGSRYFIAYDHTRYCPLSITAKHYYSFTA